MIYPEQEAGERTAHLLGGTMRNFTEFSPGHALANITIPKTLAGRPMRDLRLTDRYGVIVVAYEDANNFHHVDSETQLPEGGNMLVAGPTHRVDEFARRL